MNLKWMPALAGTIGLLASAAAPAMAGEADGIDVYAVEQWIKTEYIDQIPVSYAVAGADLNGDGRKEAILYVAGSRVCVVGKCDAVVLTPGVGGYDQVMTAGNAELPISLLDSRTNGWRDLSARVTAGGGTTAARKLSFDRSSSRAANMLPEAEAQAGQVLIAETATLKLLGH